MHDSPFPSILACVLLLLLGIGLVACNDDDSNHDNPSADADGQSNGANDGLDDDDSAGADGLTISGLVTDPPVAGATVSLTDLAGKPVGEAVTSDATGHFELTGIPTDLEMQAHQLIASGGVDSQTGQALDEVTWHARLTADTDLENVVVSPLSSLVHAGLVAGFDLEATHAHWQERLGELDLHANPQSGVAAQRLAMQISLLTQAGVDYASLVNGLDTEAGIDRDDLSHLLQGRDDAAAATEQLALLLTRLAEAGTLAELSRAMREVRIIERALEIAEVDLTVLPAAQAEQVKTNVRALAAHGEDLRQAQTPPLDYLRDPDILATLAGGGGVAMSAADSEPEPVNLDHPAFAEHLDRFSLKLVDTAASFDDSLMLAYYSLPNPETGNEQLIVYDATTGEQTVIKTNVIFGDRVFVFTGSQTDGETRYEGRRYGLFLDPSVSKERRRAPDDSFDYDFYTDNILTRFEIANPNQETVVFAADRLGPDLQDQGISVIGGDFSLHDNVSDPDDSYVELKAYEHLADPLRGEASHEVLHLPLVVRLGDSSYRQGHFVSLLKDDTGQTSSVLLFHAAPHTRGNWPEGTANRARLQQCTPDLSECADVTAAGGLGDGKFFFLADNAEHVYLAKQGSATLYAFDKTVGNLSQVNGVRFPAPFDKHVHLQTSTGHGGSAVLNNFSSLPGPRTHLSDGDHAYLAINYDLDTQDPVGSYRHLGDIFIYKHAQILKLSGTTGELLFDNGDGVDNGDASDAETVAGHVNLIAVANERLFFEIGNYEAASAGGGCVPDESGYYCSAVRYGFVRTDTVAAEDFDTVLHEADRLRYFVARRLPPYAINDRIYISILHEEGGRGRPHIYDLYGHASDAPVDDITVSRGRSYLTRAGERPNGLLTGTVLAWDGTTHALTNVSTGQTLGNVAGVTDNTAIGSVFGRTSGIPLAGIGSLYALRADPGGHDWYLLAGAAETPDGATNVGLEPLSTWLYE